MKTCSTRGIWSSGPVDRKGSGRMSSFSRILVLAGIFALALTIQGKAAVTGGPYIDFKGYLGTDNQIPTNFTTHTVTYYQVLFVTPNSVQQYYGSTPHVGPLQVLTSSTVVATDYVGVGPSPNLGDPSAYRQVLGVSYLTYDPSSTTADLVLTTIYGVDSNPTNPA